LDVKQKVAPLPVAETDRERLYLNGKGIVSGYHAIRSAEARLDKFEVRAPFAGAITGASVEPGSMVRAAQPLGTLVGTSAFEIKSAVHARHLGRLAVGNAVSFVQEDGRPVAVGTVVRISGTVDVATQSASVFSQVMALEDEVLRDGRYLSGVVSLSPVFNAVRLNAELVQEIGEASVLILEGQRLSRQPVTVLHWDGDEAIVTGLEPDTPLLAAPVSGTHEGMLVNVIQE
jgi:multidrug efflux pump subunit AcrA (membrane-fusion protein)